MRNVWMIVSGIAVVIALGGTAYYFFPKQPVNPAVPNASLPVMSSTDTNVLLVPAGNPLLTAGKAQFGHWMPAYCGADLFLESDPQLHQIDVCVNGTVSRVVAATGVRLTRADVLDPRVKTHWREVMGAK